MSPRPKGRSGGGQRQTGFAKRSLSQNFLLDPNLQRKTVSELEVDPGDTVLEIGPGHGELTQHLIGRVRRIVAVEKDDALALGLEERWKGEAGLRVHSDDALEISLDDLVDPRWPLRVLSNVPYGITSPLLFAILAIRPPPARIVVTVQREVAERIVARPGTRAYGALSVGVQAVADARIAFRVARSAFRPVPEVDSAVVRIELDPRRCERVDTESLRALTRAAFSRRRKQLQKILRTSSDLQLDARQVADLCERLGLDPRSRPEELSADTFVRLAEILFPTPGSDARRLC
jgi:16S rRNA (adenine1518-N6/adenine1519-N6)-dimethyltransferase